MENNNFFRGRGRARSGRRNFFDRSVSRDERNKKDSKNQQIEAKKDETPKVIHEEKKESLIEKGKAWISKHFNGMTKSERGNIKVELNPRVDFELFSMYESKLHNIVSNQFVYSEQTRKEAEKFLKPFISTLIGIKLLKANTQHNKATMIGYKGISDIDLRAPGNLSAIIDNFGKSDAINDNVIRIKAQNSYIKTRFLNSIVDFCGLDQKYFNSYNFGFTEGIKFTDIKSFRDNHIQKESNLRLYTVDAAGIEMINSLGMEAIEYLNNTDLVIPVDNSAIYARAPFFNPKRMKDIDYIFEWEANARSFFTRIKHDYASYLDVLGMALVAWLPLRFIQRRKDKMKDIDERFDGTVFANATPDQFLTKLELYPMDVLMSEQQLIDNIITFLGLYKEKYERVYDLAFNMKDFKPTEFGTSAQIVENHQMTSRYLDNSDSYGEKVTVVSNRIRTQSKIKMRDDEALLGTIFKFSRKVEMVNNYDINYSNTTQQIRLDYVMKDFKV